MRSSRDSSYFIIMNWTVERSATAPRQSPRRPATVSSARRRRVLHRSQPAVPRAAGMAAFGHLLQLVRLLHWVLGHTARGAHRRLGKTPRAHSALHRREALCADLLPHDGVHVGDAAAGAWRLFRSRGPYLLAGVLVIRKVMAGSLNPLKARRSVVKYSSKRVPKAATQRALEAAIMAPKPAVQSSVSTTLHHLVSPRCLDTRAQVALLHRRPRDEGQAVRPQRRQAQGRRGRARVARS